MCAARQDFCIKNDEFIWLAIIDRRYVLTLIEFQFMWLIFAYWARHHLRRTAADVVLFSQPIITPMSNILSQIRKKELLIKVSPPPFSGGKKKQDGVFQIFRQQVVAGGKKKNLGGQPSGQI